MREKGSEAGKTREKMRWYAADPCPVPGTMLTDCSILWDHPPMGLVNYYVSGQSVEGRGDWGGEKTFPSISHWSKICSSALYLPHISS